MGLYDHSESTGAGWLVALAGVVTALWIASIVWISPDEPDPAAMPKPAADDRRPVADMAKREFETQLTDSPKPEPWLNDDDRYDGKVIRTAGQFVRLVTVYENCGIAETASGCDLKTYYDHPYNDFSFSDLDQIADFDAVAAFIIAERIFSRSDYRERFDGDDWYEAGVNHYLRAAVLSGHKQPYEAMLTARDLVPSSDDQSAASRHRARELYIWAKAGVDLGYLAPNHRSMDIALQYFKTNPSVDPEMSVEKLNEEADAIRQFLINLKANTTG
ncbi:MAG: hypothetical protein GWN47_11775 [Woeseiaceae bacterium]|nr:hypothetical protein [Woeseiaceae bacterium]